MLFKIIQWNFLLIYQIVQDAETCALFLPAFAKPLYMTFTVLFTFSALAI